MIEERSHELLWGEDRPLTSTRIIGDASSGYDFNKYDPYVEKIRTLFVPSLEPRIYSCLETFVYRQESGPQLDSPYLKRCLDVAATWREPVDAFCTKWRDAGFLEKILATAIKFLISDGLIDCFLNSIILNNSLNKVCRNLDALGVEKDFLRYLAVWNYINDRDYWREDDTKMYGHPFILALALGVVRPDENRPSNDLSSAFSTASKFDDSYDSIDNHSDLDVEVGSGLGDRRNDRIFKNAFRSRATNDLSEDLSEESSLRDNEQLGSRFPSRLSIDSRNLEVSRSSSARKKIRHYQANPCRPSTCASYRIKDLAPGNWEGKILKLQLCKSVSLTSECRSELEKPVRLSKLYLPCKFDDLIAEIVKTDKASSDSFFSQRRKNFQAGVKSICGRVNDVLGKIDKNAVRKCRLQCEILPGCVSFRLTERKRDRCKVCLFSDRVALIQEEASGSNARQISEQENLEQADLTILKNTGFAPADDESQIVRTLEEDDTLKTEPEDILLRLSDDELDAKDRQDLLQNTRAEPLSHKNGNILEDSNCGCNTSTAHPLDCETINNDERSLDIPSQSKELIRKESSNHTNESAVVDDIIKQSSKNEETNRIISEKNLQKLLPRRSFNRSSEDLIDDMQCACNTSFSSCDDAVHLLDRAIEANQNVQSSNHEIPKMLESFTNSHGNEGPRDSFLEDAAKIYEIAKLQDESRSILGTEKSELDALSSNQLDSIACACPLDCTCPNKFSVPIPSEKCDSQCSCNTCGQPENPKKIEDLITSSKKIEIIRMSSLLKVVPSQKMESEIQQSLQPTIIQRNEFPTCGCLEDQVPSSHSQNLEFQKEASTKSEISLESNITKVISFIEAESKQPQANMSPAVEVSNATVVDKSPKKLSFEEQQTFSTRPLRPKGQRINISIEMCPESETSNETLSKNEFKGCKDVPLELWKPRGHSLELQARGKPVFPHPDENTKDECLRQVRGVDPCEHSPPRPLESRDYLPPFRPPSSMRNPVVYGLSRKPGIRSIDKFERANSMCQDKRQRGGKNDCEWKEIGNSDANRCRSIERKERANKQEEMPKHVPRMQAKPETFSPFNIHSNVCHAFSASSVDRMKHLIKTKLRRILLERDKATNTPKTILTNKKYRVSVPNGKSDRSSFRRERCRTIWESRSASDSAHTSRSFVSNDRFSSIAVWDKNEAKNIFYSTADSQILSIDHRNFEREYDRFDNIDDAKSSKYSNNKFASSRNSEMDRRSDRREERSRDADLNSHCRRLAGGSDDSYRKTTVEDELELQKRVICNNRMKCVKRQNRYVPTKENKRFEGKDLNHSCKDNSDEVEDSSARISQKVCRDKQPGDELTECSGKLDWSGNSTSRHIYLYDLDQLETSSNKIESSHFYAPPKTHSSDVRKTPQRTVKEYPKKLKTSRPRKSRLTREISVLENIPVAQNLLSVKNTVRREGFRNLDQDLRTKLSQYVSLCKNVKYSLLKRLRPEDIYEVSSTSIPCYDRYNFGGS